MTHEKFSSIGRIKGHLTCNISFKPFSLTPFSSQAIKIHKNKNVSKKIDIEGGIFSGRKELFLSAFKMSLSNFISCIRMNKSQDMQLRFAFYFFKEFLILNFLELICDFQIERSKKENFQFKYLKGFNERKK